MWALFPTILFLCSMHYSWGYRIDSSCQADNKIQQIKNAATEAINIAANAIARTDFGNNPGTMMMDLFGDNSQQMYQSAKSCYQDALTKTGTYSENENENLAIYCGSQHLILIDSATGTFRDPSHGNAPVKVLPPDGSKQACSGGNIQSFGYPLIPDGSGFIMVLCQLAFDKSKMDSRSSLPAKLSSWRFGGPLENENDKVPKPLKPVDFVAQYLSVKFLHEMMHVGNCIKLPNQLPDSKKSEAYGYHAIAEKNGNDYALSSNDKKSNADSYTLAASAMFCSTSSGDALRQKRSH